MSAAPSETPGPQTPLRVLPLPPPSTGLSTILLIGSAGALGAGIFRLMHPAVLTERSAEVVMYFIDSQALLLTAGWLVLGALLGSVLLIRRPQRVFRTPAAIAIVVGLGLLIVVHHHSSRLTLGSDTFTLRQRGGLFPGEEVTIRFDQLAMFEFIGRPGGSSRPHQQCYLSDRITKYEFDLGPLLAESGEEFVSRLQGHGVKVLLRY